jgi:hypothetical protein
MQISKEQTESAKLQMELSALQMKLSEQQMKLAELQMKVSTLIVDLNDGIEEDDGHSSERADTKVSLQSILNLAAKTRKTLN